jgi:integrase/recombinase XerC
VVVAEVLGLVTVSALQLADAARIMRDAMRDDSYLLLPMGVEVEAYMRAKRKQLTKGSERKYRAALAELALHFPDLDLRDFEPPVGTERLEEFMDARWGHLAPRTYNSCLSAIKDFFKWQNARGYMHGDPALSIERAKARDPHRETFNADQVRAIVASQEDLRDRIALRLLLNYGLRKDSLRSVQFKHFDHVRRRLTVFYKGGKNRAQPVPDVSFWHDLERLILDSQAEPGHYLLPGAHGNRHGVRLRPDTKVSNHRLHDWWYARLSAAGIVAEGVTSGERMHKARHTAGQILLDATGNLKAVQGLLMHESIMTTADTYVAWDLDQLAQSLAEALREDG